MKLIKSILVFYILLYIYIGNKKVNFDIHDAIFKLNKPNNYKIESTQCACCDKDI